MTLENESPAQHSAYPGSTADQVDPRTYGTEQPEDGGDAPTDAQVAQTELADAKANGSLLNMPSAQRNALYARAYGPEGDQIDNVTRSAFQANDADQAFEEFEVLRRTLSNGLGPHLGEAEQQELDMVAGIAEEIGLNRYDVSTAAAFNETANSPEEAWQRGLEKDVQLSRLTAAQQEEVRKMVVQAVAESPQATAAMEQTDLGNSVGVQIALGRKAGRVLARKYNL